LLSLQGAFSIPNLLALLGNTSLENGRYFTILDLVIVRLFNGELQLLGCLQRGEVGTRVLVNPCLILLLAIFSMDVLVHEVADQTLRGDFLRKEFMRREVVLIRI